MEAIPVDDSVRTRPLLTRTKFVPLRRTYSTSVTSKFTDTHPITLVDLRPPQSSGSRGRVAKREPSEHTLLHHRVIRLPTYHSGRVYLPQEPLSNTTLGFPNGFPPWTLCMSWLERDFCKLWSLFNFDNLQLLLYLFDLLFYLLKLSR